MRATLRADSQALWRGGLFAWGLVVSRAVVLAWRHMEVRYEEFFQASAWAMRAGSGVW